MSIFIPVLTCGDAEPCACPSPCDAMCFCNLTLDTAGGESGYDETFDVTDDFVADRDIYVDFEAYSIKDQLLIDADGVNIYDSGCISGNVTATVTVPAGTTSARVQVLAHCDAGQPGTTAWTLSIACE